METWAAHKVLCPWTGTEKGTMAAKSYSRRIKVGVCLQMGSELQ